MRKMHVDKKESPEGVFHYLDLGSELHGRRSIRLWVSSRLIKCDIYGDEFVSLPFVLLPAKALISQTKKGNWVMKPSDEHLTFIIGKNCGYRGNSWYEILTKFTSAVAFEIWDSPHGILGVSRYALVSAAIEDMPLKYRWERSGRLYGSEPVGITIIEKDGATSTIDGIDELDDIKSLL